MVESTQTIDQFFVYSHIPVIAVDSSKHIIFCNEAAISTLDISAKTIIGESLDSVIQHRDVVALFNVAAPHQVDISLPDDGGILTAHLSPLEGMGALAVLIDTTHQHKMDAIKTNFMNTIARDVRSPLTAILGYVELLERIGSLNEQQRDFIGRIIFSVHSITAMLTNAMELEKIEAGMDTGKEVLAIEQIVSYTIEGLKKRIDGKQQTCEVLIDAPLPQIWGNPIRLRQLTTALVENAIKYTAEGGVIRVEVYAESDFIILMVADNGIGISPEEQPYIFEKFYRASNVNDSSVGSGLGLSIVQSIVEQHDGRIWVDSQPNEGTAFTVMLPCYAVEETK